MLELDESNIKSLNDLAISYSITNDILQAEDTFEKAILINPFHQLSRYNYGVFLNSINDFSAALVQFKKAIEINSGYFLAHYALIETYVKLNNKQQAEEAMKILTALAPNHNLTKQAQNLLDNL